MQFFLNTVIAAIIVAAVVQISQRSTLMGAILVSLPISSIIALSLLFLRTGDVTKVIDLSMGIFWLVIPTLGFFLLLPYLLKQGLSFWMSLSLSCCILAAAYPAYSWLLKKIGYL